MRADEKILEYLATKDFNNRITKYGLWTKLNLSRGSAYNTISELEKKGLVRKKRIGTAPAGQPMYAYALSFLGLVAILHVKRELWERIDTIASKHIELLPLLFGKWQVLDPKTKKVMLLTFRSFFEVAYFQAAGHLRSLETGEPVEPKLNEEDYRLMIYENALWIERLEGVTPAERRAWFKDVMGDSELCEFLVKKEELRKMDYETKISHINAMERARQQRNPELFATDSSWGRVLDFRKSKARMMPLIIKLEKRVIERLYKEKKLKGGEKT